MKNGTCWLDDSGKLIQAHGGMIAKFLNKWYWYGENKDADNVKVDGAMLARVDVVGISCYSSDDLHTWHYEGLALAADANAETTSPLHPSRVMERPKVIYCEKTRKYVMWFHSDSADYMYAHAGCAVSDRPEGPFELLGAYLPNGRDCRDMTVYTDPTDGRAYLVHSSDWNRTMYFSELNEERTGFTGVCYTQLQEQTREAPALIYHNGLHYCVTSGCTGWAANSALYATTERLSSPLRLIDDPCEGPDARITFHGQSTYIFIDDGGKAYMMLDHWKPEDLRHSAYSILPIEFDGAKMTIRWAEEF